MAESLGAAVLTVSVDDQQFKAGLNRVQAQAERGAADIGQAFSRVGSVIAGLGVGVSLGALFKGAVDSAIELETITRKLSNTLGPQGAGGAIAFTKGLSDQLGLSFKTLAGGFASFTAAATAANVPLEQQKALFAAVAKAGQSLGLSNDEINGSLLALQQIASKGTVQMEELRGQLGERLPIAFAAAAKGLGITQQQLIKLIESGKLTSAQFFPAITKGLNDLTKGTGGLETSAQSLQKFQNAWDELQTALGTNLLPTATEKINILTEALKGLGVGIEANKLGLGGLFGYTGLVGDDAIKAVARVRSLAEAYNLTADQARALFFDAAKLSGIKVGPTGLQGSTEQLEATLSRLPALAEEFRKKNKDTTGELNRQNAEAQRVLELAAKRTAEEQKTLDATLKRSQLNLELAGIQEQIDNAKQLATLEGTALVKLQNKLAINEKIRQQQAVQLELQRELAKPASGEGARSSAKIDELLAKQQVVNAEVRKAYADAGVALFANAKQAADALKSAQGNLQSALRAGFEFLTPQLQQEQLTRARASVQGMIQKGVIRSGVDISAPEKLFQVAGVAENIGTAQDKLVEAQKENTAAVAELTKKDWNVYVQLPNSTPVPVALGS